MVCAQRYLLSLKSQLALQHRLCGRQVPAGAVLDCLLPGPMLGRASPAMCHTGDGHWAGGEGWQVLERRELHGKVRTKITSVSGARVTRFKKKTKTLRFISLL